MPNISLDLPLNIGDTGLTLWLYDQGVLLNTGGDALVESGVGYFTANVSQALDADTNYRVDVQDASSNLLYSNTLYAGQTFVGMNVLVDEVQKIPRADSKLTPGGVVIRTNLSNNNETIQETLDSQ